MKRLKKLSLEKIPLHIRVSCLTGTVLVFISMAITIFSISSSNNLIEPIGNPTFIEQMTDEFISNDMMTPAASVSDAKKVFDMRSIIFCIVSVFVGTFLTYLVSKKALKPIHKLSEGVKEINEENLSFRLTEEKQSIEVLNLTESINHMLDRVEEAYDKQKKFAASAAHELKTPLTTMKLNLQVTEKNGKEDKQNISLQLVNINRLNQIVDDLLLIASMTDESEIQKEEIDLPILFESLVEEIDAIYNDKQIKVVTLFEEEMLYGNIDLLYRAFFNLLENAYKYNKENGAIFIKAYSKETKLVIEISNTGPVIDEKHRSYLMDPFYRVDKSWSRDYSGAGLGLSIVKSIADSHQGIIEVSVNEKKENMFSFIIDK